MDGRKFWEITYNLSGEHVRCCVDDDHPRVALYFGSRSDLLRPKETARTLRFAPDAHSAEEALTNLWAKLGYGYPHQIANFRFSVDHPSPSGGGKRGMADCQFKLTEKHYPFVDRLASVSLAIDVADGVLIYLREDLDHPAVGEPAAKMNRRTAFQTLRLSPKESSDDWHGMLGWYLAAGQGKCRLGWSFQKRPGTTHYIVDAVSGAVTKLNF